MPTLFLAVPGTQDTRELDLESVRRAVARGEIPLDNWAWSPQRNAWLPLSQLPEFAAPAPVTMPDPPKAARREPKTIEPVKVKVAMPARASVQVPVAAARPVATGKMAHAATYYSKPIEEQHEFPIFKVLFIVLGVIIAALVLVNYCLVDQPFRENMAKTPFVHLQTHAHLGAFVQPNVLLIHILPSNEVTPDNFADLLTALTQSAPREGIPGHPFDTVSLTSAWLGQYVIPGADWSGFANMDGYSPQEKKEFVLSHLQSIDGEPLVPPAKNETSAARQAREDKAWLDLVAKFQSS